jgi:hypothetical protein
MLQTARRVALIIAECAPSLTSSSRKTLVAVRAAPGSMLNAKAATVSNVMKGAERRKLSNRRGSITFNFQCNRLAYSATISRYPNGDLAEIFITNTKVGSDSDSAAKDSAVVASIALQHGVRSAPFAKHCCGIREGLLPHRWAWRWIRLRHGGAHAEHLVERRSYPV